MFVRSALQLSLGAGADVVDIFRVQRESATETGSPALGDLRSTRVLVRLVANLDPRARVLQRDQRPWVHLQIDAASPNPQLPPRGSL